MNQRMKSMGYRLPPATVNAVNIRRRHGLKSRILLCALAISCGFVSSSALAGCDFGGEILYPASALTFVGNRTANMVALTPWEDAGEGSKHAGSCSSSAGPTFHALPATIPVGTYKDSHTWYSILPTSVSGLGVILEFLVEDAAGGYRAWNGTRFTVSTSEAYPRVSVRVKFIKYADVKTGSYLTDKMNLISYELSDGLGERTKGTLTLEAMRVTIDYAQSCRPRDTTVKMRTGIISQFTGQYSRGPAVPFEVTLDCDDNVGQIEYFIEDTLASPLVDAGRGVYEVFGGAKGIGLQVSEKDGTPVPYRVVKSFGYNTSGGEVRKTFEARYVQTAGKAADMAAGDANASLRLVMSYP